MRTHIPTPYFTFLFYYSNISEISFFVKFQFSEFCHSPKFVSSKSLISGYRKNNASFVNHPKIVSSKGRNSGNRRKYLSLISTFQKCPLNLSYCYIVIFLFFETDQKFIAFIRNRAGLMFCF